MQTGAKKVAGAKKAGIAGLHPILDVLKEMKRRIEDGEASHV